ncbi:tRNA pseudouridine(38-40) synthase TruA [Chenggangzhangella methanolivorans]|uniref:tRNA pseudouridine synthase A n=1 Tax=Chenggangzhangella methanolivorans TaxID=1437009 RepID=A0A9E6R587_9HYPH|nr:tRNA pseudouridine(38-40) synthase TruA [Chenggangzhangella methanolivorans]QZN98435.1 tRNA pseudouridine(38-40) synthase TruA [Chenggangzhangella methanolivorans]
MPRYRLIIEYDGGPFVGWQRQANGASVQGALEAAIAAFAHEAVTVKGAGRTDAGVHASGQAAHVDLTKPIRPDKLRDAANAHLRPAPIAVLEAEEVADDFDARFSAIRRHYVYRIVDRRPPLALMAGRAWRVPKRLDVEAMDAAGKRLLGRHDFTTFRSAACQALSPVKTLDRLDVLREGESVLIFTDARSFLHNQVRSIAGSLVEVGLGRWSADDMGDALARADRAACGPVAPPDGLTLVRVDYPEAESPPV